MIMLKKLFGVGFFGGFIDHLIFYQAIFLVFLGKLNLPFVVWIVVFKFLGCWALIVLALVICFSKMIILFFWM
jgi:hypothetical protein